MAIPLYEAQERMRPHTAQMEKKAAETRKGFAREHKAFLSELGKGYTTAAEEPDSALWQRARFVVEEKDDEIIKEASDLAKKETADLKKVTPEQLDEVAELFYEDIRAEREREAFDTLKFKQRQVKELGPKFMKEAGAAGAMETPETVWLSQEQRDMLREKGFYFLAGDQAKAELLRRKEVPEKELPDFFKGLISPETQVKIMDLMKEPQRGPPERKGVGSLLMRGVGAVGEYVAHGGRFGAGVLGEELERLSKKPELYPGEKRVAGVPWTQLARHGAVAVASPVIGPAAVATKRLIEEKGAQIERGVEAALDPKSVPVEEYLRNVKDRYHDESIDRAYKELGPDSTDDDILQRAEELLKEKIEEDGMSTALEHPLAAQMFSEFAFDPYNVTGFPIVKAVRGLVSGIKAVGKIPVVTKAAQAATKIPVAAPLAKYAYGKATGTVKDIKTVFKYGSAMEEELRPLGQTGREVYAEAMVEVDRARVFRDKLTSRYVEIDKLLAKAKAETVEQKEALTDILEAATGFEDLKKRGIELGKFGKKELEQYRELTHELFEIEKAAGAARRVGVDAPIVEEVREMFGYMPHRKLVKPTEEVVEEVAEIARKQPRLAGMMAREADAPAIKDPQLQFEAEVLYTPRKVQSIAELRGMTNVMKRKGLYFTYATADQADAAAKATALTDTTGVKFSAIRGGKAKLIIETSGEVGARTDDVVVVPEFVIRRAQSLSELINKADSLDQSMKVIGKIGREYRHGMGLWRVGSTVLRSPQFIATNTIGAIGIGAVNLGIRFADPTLQWPAIRTAFKASFGNSKKALSGAIRLGDGNNYQMGDVYKVMENIGVIGESKYRYLARPFMEKGGIFAGAERVARRVAEKTRLQNLAAIGDDYQKAVTFIGNLKSLDPTDIGRAAQITTRDAGNWSRMTQAEKLVFRDNVGFYGWNRFILPWLVRNVVENPQRLAVFERMTKGIDRWLGANLPVFVSGIPEWAQFQNMTPAPLAWQPDESGDIGHEVAMMITEVPMSGFGILRNIVESEFLAAPALALAQMSFGKDFVNNRELSPGEILPTAAAAESADDFMGMLFDIRRTGAGRLAERMVPLPYITPVMNCVELHLRHGRMDAAVETALRYSCTRDTFGAEKWIATALGKEPLGKGSPWPGVKTYAFSPEQVAYWKKRKAVKEFREQMEGLAR